MCRVSSSNITSPVVVLPELQASSLPVHVLSQKGSHNDDATATAASVTVAETSKDTSSLTLKECSSHIKRRDKAPFLQSSEKPSSLSSQPGTTTGCHCLNHHHHCLVPSQKTNHHRLPTCPDNHYSIILPTTYAESHQMLHSSISSLFSLCGSTIPWDDDDAHHHVVVDNNNNDNTNNNENAPEAGRLSLAESTMAALLPQVETFLCCGTSTPKDSCLRPDPADWDEPAWDTVVVTQTQALYVYVACSLQAATHCAELQRWKEAYQYAKIAVDSMGGLDRIVGTTTAVRTTPPLAVVQPPDRRIVGAARPCSTSANVVADHAPDNNSVFDLFADRRFAEWRIKAVLVMARSLARLQQIKQSRDLLGHARQMIRGQMLTNSSSSCTVTAAATPTVTVVHSHLEKAINPTKDLSDSSLHLATEREPSPVGLPEDWPVPMIDVPPAIGRSLPMDRYLDEIRQMCQAQKVSRVRQGQCGEYSQPLPCLVGKNSLTLAAMTVPLPLQSLPSGESADQSLLSLPSGESADQSLFLSSSVSDDFGETESCPSHLSNKSAPMVFGRTAAGHVELPISYASPSTGYGEISLAQVEPTRLPEVGPLPSPPPRLLTATTITPITFQNIRSSLREAPPRERRHSLHRRVTFSPDILSDEDRSHIKAFVSPQMMPTIKRRQPIAKPTSNHRQQSRRHDHHRRHRSNHKSARASLENVIIKELEKELEHQIKHQQEEEEQQQPPPPPQALNIEEERRDENTEAMEEGSQTSVWSRPTYLVRASVTMAAGVLAHMVAPHDIGISRMHAE